MIHIFFYPIENKHTDTTDNSLTDNEESVDKINSDKDEDRDDEYKEYKPESPKNNKSVINKTKTKEVLTDCDRVHDSL